MIFIVVVIILPITQNVPVSRPAIITWSLFSTLPSSIDKLLCSKLTSHPKHRTAGNSFFSYLFIFFQISKKVVAKVLKMAVFFLIFELCLLNSNCILRSISPQNQKKKKNDEYVVRTHASRSQWINSPST